ncbi:hypothetical protein H4R33_004268 [Dimargaris cristalligena]|uniref:NTF2-related export protein n=1 Tax=Dimargaris cristalligena TaxID=215637 RepID=A0A4P9ZWK4_9FUNG|nr:hypothetical protein H4R33_004268 [Dimargaris cristalligena]RKP38046.1 hypothetical protein BJ085DRAFT_28977 [Dimargaris cristalligena]|eukprot:RKP38046.1 hypothetical protein BJ085DRAFT_28977 [Dimargaris cristalligena]
MADPKQTLSEDANTRVHDFVELYYHTLDTAKASAARFYTPNSLIVWNGQGFQGFDQFLAGILATLSATKHEIETYDAQPIAAWNAPLQPGTLPNIIVQVSGTVQFLPNTDLQTFNHTFILTPNPQTPGSYYISNETFRLV